MSGDTSGGAHGSARLQAERMAIEAEHDQLVVLLASIGGLCSDGDALRSCASCSDDQRKDCGSSLDAIGRRLMNALLNHFHREDALMETMIVTDDIRHRLRRHRDSHVELVTRYNQAIVGFVASDPKANAQRLEDLLLGWIRGHALQFDAELLELLRHTRLTENAGHRRH